MRPCEECPSSCAQWMERTDLRVCCCCFRMFVNACCPGWCSTDMSSWGGRKTAEQGAETPVLLALHPPKSGAFFSEEVEESF